MLSERVRSSVSLGKVKGVGGRRSAESGHVNAFSMTWLRLIVKAKCGKLSLIPGGTVWQEALYRTFYEHKSVQTGVKLPCLFGRSLS